jgi:alkyl hydroperoxide reductase subunit AhpC
MRRRTWRICPAGWKHGDEGMKAAMAGVAEYLAKQCEGM